MVHLLSSERPALAAAPSSLFAGLANWFAKARLARARRRTYASLLELEDSRLADLGITRTDLFEAMHSQSVRPGLKLAGRRAESARNWLIP